MDLELSRRKANPSVAGVYTPAFVERGRSWRTAGFPMSVSPEFILRPSLSALRAVSPRSNPYGVSPEFILRPSLSGHGIRSLLRFPAHVSPEFILRPSLSGHQLPRVAGRAEKRVAGVYTPAFVERRAWQRSGITVTLVSPEFILRPSLSALVRQGLDMGSQGVSPEFILRPSLSGSLAAYGQPIYPQCRRSLYSGLR